MTIIIVIVDKITRSVYYYFIKNKSINFANIDHNYIKLYYLLPSDIIISFCPKSGDSPIEFHANIPILFQNQCPVQNTYASSALDC